jgi:predicted nucleotidyltransferase
MPDNILDYIFASPSAIIVLRELDLRKKGITGREAGRLAGITHKSALSVLSNLELLKIVRKEPVGRAYYFTLNRDHYLYRNIIEPALCAERDYKSALFELIKKVLKNYCESTIIYGSVARGDESAESDLDVCIVYKANRKRIEDEISNLRIKISDTFGITLAPLIISVGEIRKGHKLNKSLINNIATEGKVILGKSIGEILK